MARNQKGRLAAAPGEDLAALGKGLVESNIFEARQLAYMMLSDQKSVLEGMTITELEELGKGMDNWASVDTFSTLLAGVLWRNGKIKDQDVQNWTESEDVVAPGSPGFHHSAKFEVERRAG